MDIFGITITRTSRVNALEDEVRHRRLSMATQQTTNERLRVERNTARSLRDDMRAERNAKDDNIAELQSDYRTSEDALNTARTERNELEESGIEDAKRIEDLDLIVKGQSEVLAEKTAFVNELDAILEASRNETRVLAATMGLGVDDNDHVLLPINETSDSLINAIHVRDERIKELEADGGKNALRKDRDDARKALAAAKVDRRTLNNNLKAIAKALSVKETKGILPAVEQALKNDQRDATGKFTSADSEDDS